MCNLAELRAEGTWESPKWVEESPIDQDAGTQRREIGRRSDCRDFASFTVRVAVDISQGYDKQKYRCDDEECCNPCGLHMMFSVDEVS